MNLTFVSLRYFLGGDRPQVQTTHQTLSLRVDNTRKLGNQE